MGDLRRLLEEREEELERLRRRVLDLEEENRRLRHQPVGALEQMALTDDLTGLSRRGHFLQIAEEELIRARQACLPLAVIVIDVDCFKRVNDAFGHPVGDEVLGELGRRLRRQTRCQDLLARYGGDEFVVLLAATSKQVGAQVADRIRRSVEQDSFPTRAGLQRITISLGIAGFPQDAEEIEELIERADRAMYRAKAHGRNRVEVWGEGSGMVHGVGGVG